MFHAASQLSAATEASTDPDGDLIPAVSQSSAAEEIVNLIPTSDHRTRAREGLIKQAQRMVKRSRLENIPGKLGDNVTVPVPLVDRGRGDARNIMGIILDRDDNDLYKTAVKDGILINMQRISLTCVTRHCYYQNMFLKRRDLSPQCGSTRIQMWWTGLC